LTQSPIAKQLTKSVDAGELLDRKTSSRTPNPGRIVLIAEATELPILNQLTSSDPFVSLTTPLSVSQAVRA